jgi:hypothetical protein
MFKTALQPFISLIKRPRMVALFSLLFYLLMLFHPILFHHDRFEASHGHDALQTLQDTLLIQTPSANTEKDCTICSALGNLSSCDPHQGSARQLLSSPQFLSDILVQTLFSEFHLPITSRGPPVC